jgi:hypothetical protein
MKKDKSILWIILFLTLAISCYTSETLSSLKNLGGLFLIIPIIIAGQS